MAPMPFPTPPALSKRAVLIWLTAILAVMIARIVFTYSVLSSTFDEGIHVAAGVQVYEAGRYDIDFEHPPLARLAVGLLPYLDGARTLPAANAPEQARHVLEDSGSYWRTLTLGRLGS